MLLANKFTMLIVPNTWIFQEIKGNDHARYAKDGQAKHGYYAGNMDPGLH
jgi:hypothetical protein